MPRRLWRSTNSSVSTPFSMSAARFSRGATLIRISVVIAPLESDFAAPHPDAVIPQQLCRFEQRQTHDTRVAARDVAHEHRAEPLDRVRTRLALRLAAVPVRADHLIGELAELDVGGRHVVRESVTGAQRDAGM